MVKPMYQRIWVVPVEPGKMAAHERHPDHPDGVADVHWNAAAIDEQPDPVQVAMTPYIVRRISVGALRQVLPPRDVAPPVPTSEEVAVRDLSQINGVGPGRAKELFELGITSIAQYAQLSEAELEKVADKSDTISLSQLQEWWGQARALNG